MEEEPDLTPAEATKKAMSQITAPIIAITLVLARTGLRVLCLDEGAEQGPSNRAARVDTSGPWAAWLARSIAKELHLEVQSQTRPGERPWITIPLPDGGKLELYETMEKSVAAIQRMSPKDAQRWPEFCDRMSRLARLAEPIFTSPPPEPLGDDLSGLARLGASAWRARRNGRQTLEDWFRLVPMPIEIGRAHV